jgi:hypothetical protein
MQGTQISIGQEHTSTQVLQVRVVLVGVHLESASDAIFGAGEVTMTGLTAWSGNTGIRVVDPFSTSQPTRLEFHSVPPLNALVADPRPWTLSLSWRHPINIRTDIDAHARTYPVAETAVLRVTSEAPQPWDGFQDPWLAMRDLVTVVTQHPSLITSRTLAMRADDPTRVDLYYTSATDPGSYVRKFDPNDVIFTLAQRDFGTVMPKWFALRDSLGLSLALLLGIDYNRRGYYENQLFDVAAAAEGFHAALCPDATDLPAADHTAIKEVLSSAIRGLNQDELSAVMDVLTDIDERLRNKVRRTIAGLPSAEQRRWVSNKIGNNRPGLKSRYVELAQTRADPYAVSLLLTDVEMWAQWLRTARNAVGHVSGDDLEKIPESARSQLLYVTRALLLLVLLAELGLDAEAQQQLADDSAMWGHRARQFRQAVEEARLHVGSTRPGEKG